MAQHSSTYNVKRWSAAPIILRASAGRYRLEIVEKVRSSPPGITWGYHGPLPDHRIVRMRLIKDGKKQWLPYPFYCDLANASRIWLWQGKGSCTFKLYGGQDEEQYVAIYQIGEVTLDRTVRAVLDPAEIYEKTVYVDSARYSEAPGEHSTMSEHRTRTSNPRVSRVVSALHFEISPNEAERASAQHRTNPANWDRGISVAIRIPTSRPIKMDAGWTFTYSGKQPREYLVMPDYLAPRIIANLVGSGGRAIANGPRKRVQAAIPSPPFPAPAQEYWIYSPRGYILATDDEGPPEEPFTAGITKVKTALLPRSAKVWPKVVPPVGPPVPLNPRFWLNGPVLLPKRYIVVLVTGWYYQCKPSGVGVLYPPHTWGKLP